MKTVVFSGQGFYIQPIFKMKGAPMKLRYFFIALILAGTTTLFAGDLFFSEYIEGASNNRAIEIYNGTGSDVDLSAYSIKQSYNGTGWGAVGSSYCLPLTGTLTNGDVYVICASDAAAGITNAADLKITYGTGVGQKVIFFTSNDAMGLFKNDVLVDVIGVETEVLSSNTGWSVAGIDNGTYDHTLVRKPTITSGNSNWTASAGTDVNNSEWLVYPKDTFTYLGSHSTSSGGNIKPLSDAGKDQVVALSSVVILDGSSSADPDGNIVTYSWLQINGENVTLTTPLQAITQFTAPSSETSLIFELTVTDDSSATDKDTIIVSVVDDSPSKIFISEYVEGTSYNKYIEIYNGGDESLNLTTAGYELKISFNGLNTFSGSFSDWGTKADIPAGGVIVLANSQATAYSSPDIVAPYSTSSPLNFNGNDAIALFKNNFLVDLVGVPNSDADIIKDVDLRRKNSITSPNPIFNLNEWDQFVDTDISNLGMHSANPNAPQISQIAATPEFVTSANEITVTATITPMVGTIFAAKIWYGSAGSLVNSTDMYLESGNSWAGAIPSQTGNSILEFKIIAEDNSSPANSSQSPVQSLV
ncbi:MAG: lamin tail domain-containing protein, partial [archaeon]